MTKLSGHIPKFSDNDVFPYGGSDFTVGKWTFGKVTLVEIDHVEIVVPCELVLAAFKNIKAEIYAIEHKA